ncbi:MAG: ACT domain-containing protein [Candidatus Brocadiia bacterium]
MRITKQFAIMSINKPGVLANIAKSLAEKKVNIIAMIISDAVELGVLRIVVDKVDVARPVLTRLFSDVTETDVLLVDMPNRPGTLADVAEKLGQAHININYAYATTGAMGGQTTVILKVQYPEKAIEVLKEITRKTEGRPLVRQGYSKR